MASLRRAGSLPSPDARVVCFSLHPDSSHKDKCLSAGALAYVSKADGLAALDAVLAPLLRD
jgi:DNA-binding NarL/FixJ family response regulator